MTDPAASEDGRALAARRPRATFVCEVCHQPFEAWVRKPDKQPARTCSATCRSRLHRAEKNKARAQ